VRLLDLLFSETPSRIIYFHHLPLLGAADCGEHRKAAGAIRWRSAGKKEAKRELAHYTEYRVLPEPGAQSFEQVFRFDKEAKPSL